MKRFRETTDRHTAGGMEILAAALLLLLVLAAFLP